MFARLEDFTVVVEVLRRLPLDNVTQIVLRLHKGREWMNDDALQPLRAAGALLAGAAALESVVIKWDMPEALIAASDAEK